MAAHTIGGEARWVQSASGGAPRTAAESARRPREGVGRRRGGLLVEKESTTAVPCGCKAWRTGPSRSVQVQVRPGKASQTSETPTATHLTEPAVRKGTVLDVTTVGGTKIRQPVQMGRQNTSVEI